MEHTSRHDSERLQSDQSDRDRQPADEDPLSPAESAALIDQGRNAVHQQLGYPAGLTFTAWGLVWVIGFGLVYLASEGSPGPDIPPAAAWTVTGVMVAVAMAISIIAGVRSVSGIRGPSQRSGAMIGWSYTYSFIALGAICGGLAGQGVADETISLLWPAGGLLVLGVLTLGSGAVAGSNLQYGVGLALLAVSVASVYAGFPTNFLVVSLGGGGTFLAVGILAARRPHLFEEIPR